MRGQPEVWGHASSGGCQAVMRDRFLAEGIGGRQTLLREQCRSARHSALS